MDEHRLLLNLSARHPDLTIHTLAFERGAENGQGKTAALQRLSRYSEQMGMGNGNPNWRIILVGPASKTEAQKALPFLDRVSVSPQLLSTERAWQPLGFTVDSTAPQWVL